MSGAHAQHHRILWWTTQYCINPLSHHYQQLSRVTPRTIGGRIGAPDDKNCNADAIPSEVRGSKFVMPRRSPHDILTIRLIIFPTRFAYRATIIVQPPDTSSVNIRPHTAWLHIMPINAEVILSANDWMVWGYWCSHYIGEVSMCVLISHYISLQLCAVQFRWINILPKRPERYVHSLYLWNFFLAVSHLQIPYLLRTTDPL